MAIDDSQNSGPSDNKSGRRRTGRAVKTYKLPTEDRLTRSAVHYLDRYASSSKNLRKVLLRKVNRAAQANGKPAEEFEPLVDAVVAKCQRAGMVDDRIYAETKLAGLRRRGRSERQITAALSAKGVSKEIISAVLSQDDISDIEAAGTYARRRRLGPWRTRGDRFEYRQKDLAAMCRAGYSYDVALKVIDAVCGNADAK